MLREKCNYPDTYNYEINIYSLKATATSKQDVAKVKEQQT